MLQSAILLAGRGGDDDLLFASERDRRDGHITQFVVVRLEFCCNDRMNRFEASPNSLSTKSFSRLKPAPYWWACSR